MGLMDFKWIADLLSIFTMRMCRSERQLWTDRFRMWSNFQQLSTLRDNRKSGWIKTIVGMCNCACWKFICQKNRSIRSGQVNVSTQTRCTLAVWKLNPGGEKKQGKHFLRWSCFLPCSSSLPSPPPAPSPPLCRTSCSSWLMTWDGGTWASMEIPRSRPQTLMLLPGNYGWVGNLTR